MAISAKDYRGQLRCTSWFWQLENDFNKRRWSPDYSELRNEEVGTLRRDVTFKKVDPLRDRHSARYIKRMTKEGLDSFLRVSFSFGKENISWFSVQMAVSVIYMGA